MEGFKAIGLSYKHTPIDLRECVAFSASETNEFLLKVKETFTLEESLLVSTCNRTEFYYYSKDNIADELIKLIAAQKALSYEELRSHFEIYDHKAATKRLFRVTLGLESQVLGDIQIANQIKKAYQAKLGA